MSVPKRLLAALDERDGHLCAWTGVDTGRLVPQHRANRGMGGRKSLDRISNLIWIDSLINGLVESDPKYQAEAVRRGIKVSSHRNPDHVPVEFWDGRVLYLLPNGGIQEQGEVPF